MMLRTDSLFPVAVLALLAAMTFWLERASQLEEPKRDGKDRHDPDFVIERFTVRKLNEAGTLQYSLVADRMVHYPDDDSTEVTQPRLTYTGQPQISHMSARFAHLNKDAKIVTLRDDVVARREARRDNPELRVQTSVLTVLPDDEVAYTEAPVRIFHGRSVVDAIGMNADNRKALLVLKSRVRAFIDRTNK